jgi:hypothetical protein
MDRGFEEMARALGIVTWSGENYPERAQANGKRHTKCQTKRRRMARIAKASRRANR